MKSNSIYTGIITGAILLALSACNKQIDAIQPLNYVNAQGELSTFSGILEATNGSYTNLLNTAGGNFDNYEEGMHTLSDTRGNNLVQDISLLSLKDRDAYNYTNSALGNDGFGDGVWKETYQLIVGINTVLEGINTFKANGNALSLTATQAGQLSHATGENLFLRGLAYFNLVRLFGLPYYNNPGTNPGVMIKNDDNPSNIPGRSTVKDTYTQIIGDLQQAAVLMEGSASLPNTNANAAAAWALLSRVYLYMGGSYASPSSSYNQLAITYADSVINAGPYTLLQGTDFQNMFAPDESGSLGRVNVNGNSEVIFAYNHVLGDSWVNSIYHYLNYYGTKTGGFNPSPSYLSLLTAGDLRNQFLQVNPVTSKTETTKFDVKPSAWLDNAPYIYLRLAEVYLNRAEAEVKNGDNADALSDLNAIHTRAGLAPLSGLTGQDLFNAILLERRIELAFEGHNSFDDFRNGLPMIRPGSDTGGNPFIMQPDDPKVVMRIPTDELITNPKLVQNNQ